MKLGKASGAAAGLTNTVYGDEDDCIVFNHRYKAVRSVYRYNGVSQPVERK